jgi:hypothetical protein
MASFKCPNTPKAGGLVEAERPFKKAASVTRAMQALMTVQAGERLPGFADFR